MKHIIWITTLLCIILFLECVKYDSLSRNEKHEQFIIVYSKLLVLKEQIPDTQAYIDSSHALLQQYNFTQGDYEKILAYYNEKPERWEAFYNVVLEKLKMQEEE